MIKVIEAISDTNTGGAGRLLLTKLRNSDRSIFETVVLLPEGSELKTELQKQNIEYRTIACRGDKSFDLRAIPALCAGISEISPSIVNTHGFLSARVAALLCHVPVRICTRHCAFKPSPLFGVPPLRAMAGSLCCLMSNRFIAVADAAAENLFSMGIPAERIEVIINGVDSLTKLDFEMRTAARQKFGIPDGAFVAGICARLEECKGIDTFLRAARLLTLGNGNFRFLIAGCGSKEKELKELCNALGITDKVKFCGFLPDVTEFFNCLDVNINCSRGTETSSLALSEGMSIELPAIASSYGGNPYMVKDGENGMIFPTDDFYSLAKKIYRLSKDAELYKRMSYNAYRRYKNELNAKQMTEKTERLYLDLYNEYAAAVKKCGTEKA